MSKKIKCIHCKKKINDDSEQCPSCDAKPPFQMVSCRNRKCDRKYAKKRTHCPKCKKSQHSVLSQILSAVFLLIIIVIIISIFSNDETTKNLSSVEKKDLFEQTSKLSSEKFSELSSNERNLFFSEYYQKNKSKYGDLTEKKITLCVKDKIRTKSKEITIGTLASWCEADYKADPDKFNYFVDQEELNKQFNGWDGSHRKLVKYVKSAMNDDDSFDHVKTIYLVINNKEEKKLLLEMTYKGTNGYGAIVKETVVAKADLETGEILEINQ